MSPFIDASRQTDGMHYWILNSLLLFYMASTAAGNPTDGNGWAGSTANETATTAGNSLTSTTASSKVIIDSSDDIIPIQSDYDSVRSSVIFFSASLSMFAAIGIIVFFRKCVNCPTERQDGQLRHGRHHYYTAGGEIAHFRSLVDRTNAANAVTVVDVDDTSDVITGIDVPLNPSSNSKMTSQEDEINVSPSHKATCHYPLLSLADSTSGFRFYDDDDDYEGNGIDDNQAPGDCT